MKIQDFLEILPNWREEYIKLIKKVQVQDLVWNLKDKEVQSFLSKVFKEQQEVISKIDIKTVTQRRTQYRGLSRLRSPENMNIEMYNVSKYDPEVTKSILFHEFTHIVESVFNKYGIKPVLKSQKIPVKQGTKYVDLIKEYYYEDDQTKYEQIIKLINKDQKINYNDVIPEFHSPFFMILIDQINKQQGKRVTTQSSYGQLQNQPSSEEKENETKSDKQETNFDNVFFGIFQHRNGKMKPFPLNGIQQYFTFSQEQQVYQLLNFIRDEKDHSGFYDGIMVQVFNFKNIQQQNTPDVLRNYLTNLLEKSLYLSQNVSQLKRHSQETPLSVQFNFFDNLLKFKFDNLLQPMVKDITLMTNILKRITKDEQLFLKYLITFEDLEKVDQNTLQKTKQIIYDKDDKELILIQEKLIKGQQKQFKEF